MKSLHSLIVNLLLVLATTTLPVSSHEYYIKDGAIPSYLYWKQYNSSENIFPKDVIVNVSMSRVAGTFMYSFDRNMTQLIVTMRDGLPHIMDINLNKQRVSVSLPLICGCDRCRYEALELRIQLGYHIQVQCNGGQVQMFKNEYKKEINPYYPIKKSKRATEGSSSMWLVNTPPYGEAVPNGKQMYGCIFDVSYNEQSIQFTDVTSNIDNKCIKTCTDNICNGGQCYETYNGAPICNCTSTFRNGPFCNDSMYPWNLRTIGKRIQTESIKLSWNSSVNAIFEIKNKFVSLTLVREESTLYISYLSTKIRRISNRIDISNNYVPNKEYICIINFNKRNIEIWLYNDGSWSNIMMSIDHDLKDEIFDSILLRSGEGIIEMVYKDSEEYKWRDLMVRDYTIDTTYFQTASYTKAANVTTSTAEYNAKVSPWTIISIVLIVIVVVSVGVIIWHLRFKKREAPKQTPETENMLDSPSQSEEPNSQQNAHLSTTAV